MSARLWRVRAAPVWIVDVARRWSLRRRYGFDAWHVRATAANRPYKRIAAQWIEQVAARSVADVGCGLGDLGALLPQDVEYVGLDVRPAVVEAARELHRRRPNLGFALGSFEQADDTGPDMLVALNWIDGLPGTVLSQKLAAVGATYILIDAVADKVDAYDHTHLEIPGYARQRLLRQQADPRLDRSLLLFCVIET